MYSESGGGLDALLVAQIIGLEGRVIGIDMTPAISEHSRDNAAKGVAVPKSNVSIDHLRKMLLPDSLIVCIISD